MNLHPDQDQYDLQQYSPGPSSMFHLLFTSEDLAARYSHFLLMEPDVRAIRPGWVQALQQEVALSSVDFWQKGSVPYYSTFAGNLHINGNAIYKLGDQEFNCFLEREIAVQYPSSFDHSIHKTALLPENRRHLHRLVNPSEVKIRTPIFLQSTLSCRVHFSMYVCSCECVCLFVSPNFSL